MYYNTNDIDFIGKIAAHSMLTIILPLGLILLVCAIFDGILRGTLRKRPILSYFLRFVIYSGGALLWVAILPLLTSMALG